MKRSILLLSAVILLVSVSLYAAGDLIVNGNLGVGTSSPSEKLVVSHDGSSNDLVVNSTTGRVGIGTPSPFYPLHVKGVVYAEGRFETNTANGNWRIGSDFGGDTSGDLMIYENQSYGAERLRITKSGNVSIGGKVGIGTTSPTNKLHVKVGSAGGDPTGSQENIVLESNTNSYYNVLVPSTATLAGYGISTDTTNAKGGMFYEPNNDKLKFKTNTTFQMVIDTSGNVGIGTTAPARQLHINRADALGTFIQVTNTDSGVTSSDGTKIGMNSFEETVIDNLETQDIVFQIDDVTKMVVDGPTGNVGIGTTSPAYPLHMASGARVTSGGVWTNASSKVYKENIENLGVEEAIDALRTLNPVTFNYKTDKNENHVGFIAEDVPTLVATEDRKGLSPMAIVAVLTKVVQEQQKTINTLTKKVNTLERHVKSDNPSHEQISLLVE